MHLFNWQGQGRALLLAAAVVMAVGLLGCGSGGGGASDLVGNWIYTGGSKKGPKRNMELFKDGTGVSDGGTVTWKVENKRFILQSSSVGLACYYSISGSRLTLTYDDNSSAEFANKEKLAKEIEKMTSYFTDSRDGQKYRAVKIGGKAWMAQNLNYKTGNSWCYEGNDANCKEYGRLYDWNTAKTACPAGWHLPSREEWSALVEAAGGDVAGRVLKSAMGGWTNNGNGIDVYGFSALPGGHRRPDGSFFNAGGSGYWWAATEYGSGHAYYRSMYYDYDYVYESSYDKYGGFSVRCVGEN